VHRPAKRNAEKPARYPRRGVKKNSRRTFRRTFDAVGPKTFQEGVSSRVPLGPTTLGVGDLSRHPIKQKPTAWERVLPTRPVLRTRGPKGNRTMSAEQEISGPTEPSEESVVKALAGMLEMLVQSNNNLHIRQVELEQKLNRDSSHRRVRRLPRRGEAARGVCVE
jgi:hypothetical protein